MHRDTLPCGCSPAAPCPQAAEMFARGTRGRQYLYRHIECGLRSLGVQPEHHWDYVSETVVLRRCRFCELEVREDQRWRERGGEWQAGPLRKCQETDALVATVERAKAISRARRKRAAA
jgi:hypothetical protein